MDVNLIVNQILPLPGSLVGRIHNSPQTERGERDSEERELFPEVFAAARRAHRREEQSFRGGGDYITYDKALEEEFR